MRFQNFKVALVILTLLGLGYGLFITCDTATYAANASIITDLEVKDSRFGSIWSLQSNLKNGDRQFGDRQYAFTAISDALAGCDWIRTATDSKKFTGEVLATFKISVAADVYVVFDQRVVNKPAWTTDWVATKDVVANNDPGTPGFNTVKKHFAANTTVTLGPNGLTSNCVGYIVIVKAAAESRAAAAVAPAPLTSVAKLTLTPKVAPVPVGGAVDSIITDLSVKDAATAGAWSIQKNIQSGDRQFGDRAFVITSIPDVYAGYDWIRTAADAKKFTGAVLATFKITSEADILVAFDKRVGTKPEWLAAWTETQDELKNSDAATIGFRIYKKHFPANATVSVGPNGQSSGCIHYLLIAQGGAKAAATKSAAGTKEKYVAVWPAVLAMNSAWYASDEAIRVGDNVLLYQRNTGGWYKYTIGDETDMAAVLSPTDRERVIKEKTLEDSTIDNNATYTQVRYLAKVYSATKLERFRDGFDKGLDFLLKAQYDNGGWPQYYPDQTLYRGQITYNDNAMINVMYLLREIADPTQPDFKFVDPDRKAKAAVAVQKGIDCILKTQIKVNGNLTAWCAQHDAKTLAPVKARSYELESISGGESVAIVKFLMSLKSPSLEVKRAIRGAMAWFNEVKLTGIQLKEVPDKTLPKGRDVKVVSNPKAAPLWARFYEIGTNRPFFCGRDGVKKYNLAEIEAERRAGYSWYVSSPAYLLESGYPKWLAEHTPNLAELNKSLPRIYFDSGKTALPPSQLAKAEACLQLLRENPELNLEIIGHSDVRGNEAQNIVISRQRAEAVRAYLIRQGIAPERLQVTGLGSVEPLAQGWGERIWSMNRRVELSVVEAQ